MSFVLSIENHERQQKIITNTTQLLFVIRNLYDLFFVSVLYYSFENLYKT